MTSKACFRKLSLYINYRSGWKASKIDVEKKSSFWGLVTVSFHKLKGLLWVCLLLSKNLTSYLLFRYVSLVKLKYWIHAIQDFLKIRINDVSKRADLLIYSKHSSKQQALLHPIFEFSLICTKYDKYFIFLIA